MCYLKIREEQKQSLITIRDKHTLTKYTKNNLQNLDLDIIKPLLNSDNTTEISIMNSDKQKEAKMDGKFKLREQTEDERG